MVGRSWYKKRGSGRGERQSRTDKSGRQSLGAGGNASKMLHQAAKILWGSPTQGGPASGSAAMPWKIVQDKTWGMSFNHYSEVMTDFSIKAGSKKMLLSSANLSNSTGSPSKTGKAAEDQLLRKYR